MMDFLFFARPNGFSLRIPWPSPNLYGGITLKISALRFSIHFPLLFSLFLSLALRSIPPLVSIKTYLEIFSITSYADRPNTYEAAASYFRSHFMHAHRKHSDPNRSLYYVSSRLVAMLLSISTFLGRFLHSKLLNTC